MSVRSMCDSELQFPVACHIKVISDDRARMGFVIETVLMELGIEVPVTRGNTSAGGKFITHNFTFMAKSQEQLRNVDAEMRLIEGVRMVL